MYVNKLLLYNFRNYDFGNIEFSKGTNVIYGANGIGKTNILEAIYFLSYARSHRNAMDNELIMFEKENSKITAAVNCGGRDKTIEIGLFKNKKKQISINKISVNKTSDLLGVLNVVMFCPENLRIVKGSPKDRRKTVDMGMCRYGRKYFKILSEYSQILEQRNRLLKDDPNSDVLDIWTEKLAQSGAMLYSVRKNYIEKLSAAADVVHQDICNDKLRLEYKSGIYIADESDIYGCFLNELNKNLDKDKRFGITLNGCHRDDFKIFINEIDTKTYASQGQQRTAAISLKMAELNMLKSFFGEMPVLLLDDVLSELDIDRQSYILNNIKDAQVIITCTEADKFTNANLIDAEKIKNVHTFR